MWLFAAFLAVPLIEIALFIQIGGAIGLGWTLLIVILTAVIGTYLVRTQGLMTLRQLQSSFSTMQDPTEPLAHGAMILFAGALLLTPGFATDTFGFALMVPGIRSAVFGWLKRNVVIHQFGSEQRKPAEQTIIDAEYKDVSRSDEPSGWTKH